MKKQLLAFALLPIVVLACAWAAEPADNWTNQCVSCHGKDGKGQTKAGRMAGAKDLTSAEYQKSFTDAQAAAQIKGGMKDASGKEKMKPFGDKLSDEEIKALVAYVRAMAK